MGTVQDLLKNLLAEVRQGKKVARHRYMHVSLLAKQSRQLRELTSEISKKAGLNSSDYSVVRYDSQLEDITYLLYDDIYAQPFPKLLFSNKVSLGSEKVDRTDFTKSENPPILHRKELLLCEEDPFFQKFCNLTDSLVAAGAYRETKKIGHLKQWEGILSALGVEITDHVITKTCSNKPLPQPIKRHLTAISRNKLSMPMRSLALGGCLKQSFTVLDYGCGRGDDVRILKDAGFKVRGWDPFFAAAEKPCKSDVVNLGFVLNVIEDETERRVALLKAWSFTKKVLCVGVMLRSQTEGGEYETVTSRKTYQKYYTQKELKNYVAELTERQPISAGPGVVLVFRKDEDEQDYLLRRQIGLDEGMETEDLPSLLSVNVGDGRITQHKELLREYWEHCLIRARLLDEGEYPQVHEIKRLFGSARKALGIFIGETLDEQLLIAASARKNEILLWLGLNQFEERKSSNVWPNEIRRDVSRLFGNQTAAKKLSKEVLFSLSDRDGWVVEFKAAENAGLGTVDADCDYMFLSNRLKEQSMKTRMLVGCAEIVVSPSEDYQITRINPTKRSVSWLHFDTFNTDVFPALHRRLRVHLSNATSEMLDYSKSRDKLVIILKEKLFNGNSRSRPPNPFKAHLEYSNIRKPSVHYRSSEIRSIISNLLIPNK